MYKGKESHQVELASLGTKFRYQRVKDGRQENIKSNQLTSRNHCGDTRNFPSSLAAFSSLLKSLHLPYKNINEVHLSYIIVNKQQLQNLDPG